MTIASERFIELAARPGRDLDAIFAAGSPPDVAALTWFEFRGYNQPRTLALLGIRKFIKAFYPAGDGRVLGCNTPVAQNGLHGEWLAKPSEDRPRRYGFFLVEPPDPDAGDLRRGTALLDYGRGGNRGYNVARLLRDYLVRIEPGSDDLLLGRAYVVLAGRRPWRNYFLLERHRPLRNPEALGLLRSVIPHSPERELLLSAAAMRHKRAVENRISAPWDLSISPRTQATRHAAGRLGRLLGLFVRCPVSGPAAMAVAASFDRTTLPQALRPR